MEPRPSTKDQEDVKRDLVRRVRFDIFEVDFEQRELRRDGQRVSLQQKPFQVLELLLRHAGELVSRTRLARHLWPNLHVDFDRNLNTAVNALRQALNDAPHGSRFIETRPGLGYRFLAEVEIVERTPPRETQSTSREDLAESVMAAVAGALHLPRRASPRFTGPATANREAYADYRRGRYFLDRCSEPDLIRSKACFEAAVQQDPASALAYSGLAEAYCALAYFAVISPEQASPRADELARHAVQLDGDCPEAIAALARVEGLFHWNWTAAETLLQQALGLDPDNAHTRALYASVLAANGRWEEALAESTRARDAEPLSFSANLEAARLHYLANRFEEAAAHAWSALALEPKLAYAQYLLGLAYEQLRLFEEAMTEFENSLACAGNPAVLTAALGHAWAQAGNDQEARAKLAGLEALAARQYVPHLLFAFLYTGLGEQHLALAALEESVRAREVWLTFAKTDPRLAPLRGLERFHELFQRT